MDKEFFTGKNVLIMGLGRFGGGLDSAIFSAQLADKVVITDTASEDKLAETKEKLEVFSNIEYVFGEHCKEDFQNADIVIANPAVRNDNEFLQAAQQGGAVITSQIEIFFDLCKAKTIGITGSNGKSTTTALAAHLLDSNPKKMRNYDKVFLAGNIGNKALLAIIDEITADDIVVLELSSFQLMQLARIERSPNVSLITNLSPNHLDWHKDFEEYAQAKENIFSFQKAGDLAVFNAEDDATLEMAERLSKSIAADCDLYKCDDVPMRLVELTPLAGRANLSNLAGAIKIAKFLGVGNKSIKEAIKTFKPLEHRLELVSKKDGIRWYNDSIATTPESTIVALEAFTQNKILIAGGYDKGISFDGLCEKIKEFSDGIKAVILIGQTSEKIAEAIDGAVEVIKFDSLEQAVKQASQLAKPGDAVLLSPACASYDMFDNFQQRGEIFRELIKQLSHPNVL